VVFDEKHFIPVGETLSPSFTILRLDIYRILKDPRKQRWPSSSLGNQRTGSWENLTNGQKQSGDPRQYNMNIILLIGNILWRRPDAILYMISLYPLICSHCFWWPLQKLLATLINKFAEDNRYCFCLTAQLSDSGQLTKINAMTACLMHFSAEIVSRWRLIKKCLHRLKGLFADSSLFYYLLSTRNIWKL
jgi:hypothetical protein